MTSTKFYKTKKFKKLQEKWYHKLDRSGFNDVEDYRPGYDLKHLKVRSDYIGKRIVPSTRHYFRICRNFLAHGIFVSKLDFNLWKLHSEGLSYRKISPILKTLHPCKRRKYSIFWISQQITRLRKQMYHFNDTAPEGLGSPEDFKDYNY